MQAIKKYIVHRTVTLPLKREDGMNLENIYSLFNLKSDSLHIYSC